MKQRFFPRYLIVFACILAFSLLSLASCTNSQTNQPEFYNAGNANLSITGAQFDQYYLIRFDTSTSAHTFALPSAADIIGNLSSPQVGEVFTLGVTADGLGVVTLIAGTNVTIRPSALTVMSNTTLTMYAELDNVTSGSEAVTIY